MNSHEHDHHHHDHDADPIEEPLDAANQSLSDALRASFSILKAIMIVLVVLYLFSNVKRVDSHEQAIVLRLGALLTETPREAGLMFALPSPVDEIVKLPSRASNTMTVKSHTFLRRADEEGKPLDFLVRGSDSGLDPRHDGALITADGGLVHLKWKVTFKFDDPKAYVQNVSGKQELLKVQLDAAEQLVKTFVESEGIRVASEKTAEQMIRTDTDTVQSIMKRRVNRCLSDISCGIIVEAIEMDELTPPIAVRQAFIETQGAENSKQREIREAEQDRENVLSEAAGVVYPQLLALLDELDAAKAAGTPTDDIEARLDDMLLNRVEGEAGRLIKESGSYFAQVEGQMRSDLELYRVHLKEFRRTPRVLIARLWEEVQQEILNNPDITKMFRPAGLREFRLIIPLDPEQERLAEERRLENQKFDAKRLLKRKWHAVGPDFE